MEAGVEPGKVSTESMIPIEPAKVDEPVDCVESDESDDSSACCSGELPGDVEAEVKRGKVLTLSREAMIPFEPFKELFTSRRR